MKQEWRHDVCVADQVLDPSIYTNWVRFLFQNISFNVDVDLGTSVLDNSFFEGKENNKIFEQFHLTCTTRLEGNDYLEGQRVNHMIYQPLISWCMANNWALEYNNIDRCKVNLQTRGKMHGIDKYNLPHVDNPSLDKDEFTAIFYLNDSDGDTYLFKEPHEKILKARRERNIDVFNNLTFKSRISPIKNRLIVFPTSQVHAGSHPVHSSYRSVINYNFKMASANMAEDMKEEWFGTPKEHEQVNDYIKSTAID